MRASGVAIAGVLLCSACGGGHHATPDASEPPPIDAMPEDLPPGPVTALTATPQDPAGIFLGWVLPGDADLAGVLVVVSDAPITFAPTDGTAYTVDQDLGGGQRVLSVAAGTSAALSPATIAQTYHFAAWAYDAARQYSSEASTTGRNAHLGPQTGQISVDLTTQAVTVNTQPANLTLSGTAVYDDAADTLTIDLTVENDTPRILFNLKALTTAQNEGAQAGGTFPQTGGQPMTYYGPQGLDVAATATRTISLTGITGATDPVTLDLSFVDAPMLISATYQSNLGLADSSGSGEIASFADLATGSCLREGVVSPDASHVYAGGKTLPAVTMIDTRTWEATASAALIPSGIGSVASVAQTADGGRLFALLTVGTHWQGGAGDSAAPATNTHVDLVELAPGDLTEVQRIPLVDDDASFRTGRSVAISPDGATAAVVLSAMSGDTNELHFVDLASFTDTHTVALPSNGFAGFAAWMGGSVIVSYSGRRQHFTDLTDPPDLSVVDASTFAVTSLAVPATAGLNGARPVVHGGKVYYPSRVNGTTGLVVFDGTTPTAFDTIDQSRGLVFSPEGDRYYLFDWHGGYTTFDTATNAGVDTSGDGIAPDAIGFNNSSAELLLITPF